jgi:CheY-like chemotaxis protein
MTDTTTQKAWCILVVDDEPNNLQLLRQILKGKYNISLATGGLQAVELASSQNAAIHMLGEAGIIMMTILVRIFGC